MSLSDIFCVERHKEDFLNLVKSNLDIVFANEQEIQTLCSENKLTNLINFSKSLEKNYSNYKGRGWKYCCL